MLIDTLLKNLEGITWSNEFSMYYVLNSREIFTTIFDLFRGKVWINAEALFPNKKRKRDSTPQNLHQFKTRTSIPGRKFCPISYIDKLELKGYAFNTAKTYIACFESFINYYNQYKLLEIDEFMIRKYLQYLISKEFSDSAKLCWPQLNRCNDKGITLTNRGLSTLTKDKNRFHLLILIIGIILFSIEDLRRENESKKERRLDRNRHNKNPCNHMT